MTTALFTVLLLGRTLGPHKWASLVVLMCGCIFVNLDSLKPPPAGAAKQEGWCRARAGIRVFSVFLFQV
jgi:drug/metabolite transporter (DMT)-like permease